VAQPPRFIIFDKYAQPFEKEGHKMFHKQGGARVGEEDGKASEEVYSFLTLDKLEAALAAGGGDFLWQIQSHFGCVFSTAGS
jgi:hypothetical protein